MNLTPKISPVKSLKSVKFGLIGGYRCANIFFDPDKTVFATHLRKKDPNWDLFVVSRHSRNPTGKCSSRLFCVQFSFHYSKKDQQFAVNVAHYQVSHA